MFIKTLICIEMAKQTIKQSSEAEWIRINFSYCFEKKKVWTYF